MLNPSANYSLKWNESGGTFLRPHHEEQPHHDGETDKRGDDPEHIVNHADPGSRPDRAGSGSGP
jgi:hypothetical protein